MFFYLGFMSGLLALLLVGTIAAGLCRRVNFSAEAVLWCVMFLFLSLLVLAVCTGGFRGTGMDLRGSVWQQFFLLWLYMPMTQFAGILLLCRMGTPGGTSFFRQE